MVKFLLEHGAAVSAVNSQGGTPLHDAVDRGSVPITEVSSQVDMLSDSP